MIGSAKRQPRLPQAHCGKKHASLPGWRIGTGGIFPKAQLPVALFQTVGHGHNSRPSHSRFTQDNSRPGRFMNVNDIIRLAAKKCLSRAAASKPCESMAPEPLRARIGHIVRGKVLRLPSKGFQLGMRSEERRVGKECRSRWS